MSVTTEVRLDFIGHAEEKGAELSSFIAWLYAEPELSGAPEVPSGGLAHEASSLVVTVTAGHGLDTENRRQIGASGAADASAARLAGGTTPRA
jgi:hypothetical protein